MKKGFIFVETMVCIAFLGTVLLSVYASFTTVLDNAKSRLQYDDPIYLYRTYFILNFLEENGLTEYINEKFSSQANNTTYISEFGCSSAGVVGDSTSGSIFEKHFCEKILQGGDWNVNHVFIMPYNINKVVSCVNNDDIKSGAAANCRRNTALKNLSVQAVNYLYSLDGYTGSPTDDDILALTETQTKVDPSKQIYRIVVEYKVPESVENHTYYDYCLSGKKTCSNWNPESNKKTYSVTNYKYYYSSLEIPNGYNQVSNDGYELKIKFDGNNPDSWCSTHASIVLKDTYAYHSTRRSEYFIVQKGTAYSPTSGLPDYNNPDYICFAKNNKVALYGKEWNTKPDGTGVTFSHSDGSVNSDDIAAAVGCDLNEAPCTAVLYVNWVPVKSYNITYDLDGGSDPSPANPRTYLNNSPRITIVAPTKSNYKFMGWTGTDITEGTYNTSLKIPARSEGDRSYKAHWCPACTKANCLPSIDAAGTCSYGCKAEYVCTANCGTTNMTCQAANYTNGTDSFVTLADAINGTESGRTITLLKNYKDESAATFTKANVTLQLGGHTLTKETNQIKFSNGSTTITNGTITSELATTIYQTGGNSFLQNVRIINTSNNDTPNDSNQAAIIVGSGNMTIKTGSEIIAGLGATTKFAKGIEIKSSGYVDLQDSKIYVNSTNGGGLGGTGITDIGRLRMSNSVVIVEKIAQNKCGICVHGRANIEGSRIEVKGRIAGSPEIDGGAIDSVNEESCVYIKRNSTSFKCTNTNYCILSNYGRIYTGESNYSDLLSRVTASGITIEKIGIRHPPGADIIYYNNKCF